MGGGRLFEAGDKSRDGYYSRKYGEGADYNALINSIPNFNIPRDLRTFELFKTNPFKFPWQPNVVVKLMSHSKQKCTCFADCEFQKIDSCNEVFQTSLVDRQSGSTKIKHSISFPFIVYLQKCKHVAFEVFAGQAIRLEKLFLYL